MSRRDLRRAKRSRRRNAAWIGLSSGGTRIPCVLWDISATGARLAAPRSKTLPIAFNLFLNKDGSAPRVCRVVWRNDSQLGVQFMHGSDAEDVLEAGALRQLPKVIVNESQPAPSDAAALLLPGYGPQFLDKPPQRGIPISSFAAAMLFMLVVATLVLITAGMQSALEVPWALQLCDRAGNFCQHPEWTGVAGALMAVIFLTVRGMEA
jgi:hypothetical protein